MARDKRTAGKEFVAELLSLVPDTVRESVATHLQADSILDRIGEGALRHDAFSREMDALRTAQGRVAATEREQTDWWNTNRAALEEHARGQGRRRAADDDDDDPLGVRRREPTLKVEDVKKTATDITTAAMNQVEAQGITLIGMITQLGLNHFHEFAEPLNTVALLDGASKAGVPVTEFYANTVADRRKAKADAALAQQIKDAEERGKKAGIEEVLNRKGNPYPVGDNGIPPTLAGIGSKPEDYSLDAAVADLRALSAGSTS